MGRQTLQGTVGGFGTTKDGVMATFNVQAADYHVRRDNPRLDRIVAALARSWAAQTMAAFIVSSTTIVDVAEE